MYSITTERITIKVWATNLEENALEQAINLANLPFAKHWIPLMADAHLGFGMPIGGVVATENMVIPNAVGVDIGCGMNALRLSLTANQLPDNLKPIRLAIEDAIPVGFNHHKRPSAPNSTLKPLNQGLETLRQTSRHQ